MQSGELQIVKLAKNGSTVKAGRRRRPVRRLALQRTIQEKQIGAAAGRRRDRAGARAGADHRGAERDRADEGALRHRAREARRQQGRHRLAHRERAGQAGAAATPSSGCASSRRRSSPIARRPKPTSRQRRASARRRCSTCSAPSAACRTSSSRRRPPGMVNILPNFRSAACSAASRSSAKATAPGRARRSWSCPTCRRSTSRRGSTNPIAAGSRPDQEAIVRIEAIPGPRVQGAHQQHLGAGHVDFTLGLAAAAATSTSTWSCSMSIRRSGPA